MKIKQLEYENFRNFKDHGVIKFSTDGRVTIVYGENGDGKTTLHQLMQWVFYDTVSFKDPSSDVLYNHQLKKEKDFGEKFRVLGRIDFEHDNINYSLTRVYEYRNDLNDASCISRTVNLQRQTVEGDWIEYDNPQEIVERV